METIDIKELFDYFKSKIAVIILFVVLAGIIGALYGMFGQVPKYKSTTTILLRSDNSQGAALTYNDVSVNKNLVSTYSEIVKSKRVLNQVIDNLDLDYTYSNLSSMINVSAVSDTEIIKITVTDVDRKNAKKIANEAATVFVDEIPELYNISNVSVLDKAELASSPYNINIIKQFILSIMVGLVLGFGIIFLIYYFDRTVKTIEQVEKLGLPIIGTVQEYKKGSN